MTIRKRAVEYAVASMKMEGFEYTFQEKDLLEKIAEGKLPLKVLDEQINEKIEQVKMMRPECFSTEDDESGVHV